MGFTGAHVLHTFDVFILALYLLSHGCALLKYTCKPIFLAKKRKKKNHNFSVSTILDIEDLILDTVRYCEKVQDLDFRSILDTIFSRLIKTGVKHQVKSNFTFAPPVMSSGSVSSAHLW